MLFITQSYGIRRAPYYRTIQGDLSISCDNYLQITHQKRAAEKGAVWYIEPPSVESPLTAKTYGASSKVLIEWRYLETVINRCTCK